jgi:hypothetical protein
MSGTHGWPECLAKLSGEERTRWYLRDPIRYVLQRFAEARIALYEGQGMGVRAPDSAVEPRMRGGEGG